MQIWGELRTLLIALFAPAIVLGLLERAYPANEEQRVLRPNFGTDLLYFLGQYVLWTTLALGVLAAIQTQLDRLLPLAFREKVASQPLWIQMIEAVVISDLCTYWGHRLQHRSAFLWRFHSVHHSAEHLDWLAAYREHPLDGIYTQIMVNLPVLLLGLRFEPLIALFTFRGMWAVFIHSNVRIPLGPLRLLVGSPELHHWHHARDRFHGNYANLSPLMDLLFGTYRCPPKEPDAIGLTEPFPRGYVRQLLWPFRLRSR
jgi:sterol desaturase/sphingolipid hydroxylase (fatty acid hydroxylase superfamily)